MKSLLSEKNVAHIFVICLLMSPILVMPENSTAQSTDEIEKFAADESVREFESAEAAVDAFKVILSAGNFESFARLIGLDAEKVRANAVWMNSYKRIRNFAAEKLEFKVVKGDCNITIGALSWPFPFPVTQRPDGKWSFDAGAGLQEIVNWQITQHEIQVIVTLRALITAQREYATIDRDGDGILEYAQNLLSDKGLKNGLYWPSNSGAGDSPASAFVNNAALFNANRDQGYFEYHYKVLTRRGNSATGGATDYIVDGNMINGFAFVAWPVNYGETGVNTFMTSNHDVVYKADFGPNTDIEVKSMDVFNPDESWVVVNSLIP